MRPRRESTRAQRAPRVQWAPRVALMLHKEHPPPVASPAAAAAMHTAMLLRGGLSPSQVVLRLAGNGAAVGGAEVGDTAVGGAFVRDHSRQLAEVAERVRLGASVGAAFAAADGPDWRVLGAAWQLAERSGAPLAPALERIARGLEGVAELQRRREVVLAAPRMTVRLIAWLPLASLAIAFLLGADPLSLFVTPFGAALLVAGLTLQLVGARWSARLIAALAAADRMAGLECELMWIALSGGAAPGIALVRVADAVSAATAEWVSFASLGDGRPLANALAAARSAGVPAAPMLLAVARDARAATQAKLEADAERLGVRVLAPLSLCVLPAFFALGVIPVVASLVGELLLSH